MHNCIYFVYWFYTKILMTSSILKQIPGTHISFSFVRIKFVTKNYTLISMIILSVIQKYFKKGHLIVIFVTCLSPSIVEEVSHNNTHIKSCFIHYFAIICAFFYLGFINYGVPLKLFCCCNFDICHKG